MTNKTLETVIVISVALALVVMIFGSTFYTFSLTSMILFALSGVLMGAFMAPVIEPGAFRSPTLFQSVAGAMAGAVLTAAFDLPLAGVLAGAVVGVGAAWISHLWVRRTPG